MNGTLCSTFLLFNDSITPESVSKSKFNNENALDRFFFVFFFVFFFLIIIPRWYDYIGMELNQLVFIAWVAHRQQRKTRIKFQALNKLSFHFIKKKNKKKIKKKRNQCKTNEWWSGMEMTVHHLTPLSLKSELLTAGFATTCTLSSTLPLDAMDAIGSTMIGSRMFSFTMSTASALSRTFSFVSIDQFVVV